MQRESGSVVYGSATKSTAPQSDFAWHTPHLPYRFSSGLMLLLFPSFRAANVPTVSPAPRFRKRLQAGFKHVAVISANRNKLNQIQRVLMRGGSIEQPPGVGFYSPAQFISQLFNWATEDPAGGIAERAKPRKRNMPLDSGPLTEAERKLRQEEMLNNLRRVLKR
jgi:hypothetical protein